MTDFIFKISPNIVLGSYTVSRLAQNIKTYGNRFMLVLDPVLKEVNIQNKILDQLQEHKVNYFVFDELPDGANTETISQLLSLGREGHIHGIIAVGGAKALHSAAAAAALYNENHDIYDYVDGSIPTTASLPLICIPTTIRAPYIFTSHIPVIDSRNRQIKTIKIQNGICKLLLWDSNFALTLTENQTTSLTLEAICLATEAYISQKSTFFSDMFAEKAVELLSYGMDGSKSLEITTPSEVLLAQGGCMASLAAASSSIGAASLLALAMNARFKISRSLITAILFPYIIEDAAKFKMERIERIAHLMDSISADAEKEEVAQIFAENMRQRLAKANLPVRLKELSISIEQLARTAEDAGQLEFINSLPRSMTTDDLFDLLKLAY